MYCAYSYDKKGKLLFDLRFEDLNDMFSFIEKKLKNKDFEFYIIIGKVDNNEV